MPKEVRVLVVGDAGVGKSSLIAGFLSETFPDIVPRCFEPQEVPAEYAVDKASLTIVDTSLDENEMKRETLLLEYRRCTSIILVYDVKDPNSITRLHSFWMKDFLENNVQAPVILVGNKIDLRTSAMSESMAQSQDPLIIELCNQTNDIELWMECSAKSLLKVVELFRYAEMTVVYPRKPLLDTQTMTMREPCQFAFRRIFRAFDLDHDGMLDDGELNDFQTQVFLEPLQSEELTAIKQHIKSTYPQGVAENDRGVTVDGFIFLVKELVVDHRADLCWKILRKFGYNDELQLNREFKLRKQPDQSWELNDKGLQFLRELFFLFDKDRDGALCPAELDDMFSVVPGHPWRDAPLDLATLSSTSHLPLGYLNFPSCTHTDGNGFLDLRGFLAAWKMLTLLDVEMALTYLVYLSYPGDPVHSIHPTRRRELDRTKNKVSRSVFLVYVFGSGKCGKRTFLDRFVGRKATPPRVNDVITTVNTVQLQDEKERTLVLRHWPNRDVDRVLDSAELMQNCDMLVLMYDLHDQFSFVSALTAFTKVTQKAPHFRTPIPCQFIGNKKDLGITQQFIGDKVFNVEEFCEEQGIFPPCEISLLTDPQHVVFAQVTEIVAMFPQKACPAKQQKKRWKASSWLYVGVAIGVVGLVGYFYTKSKSKQAL
eukprot:gnl/Hemi2/24900_TR8374_c0_g1_i1.p1 gnl/Hemi2/24900_TR8374_c0_g1~~gnl/Hemi2/24900_TR8374_c0_g1_i1.p1  ORF type:complete len:654 (+),score=138.57 gnl/Hemi2/24900_TR8374_c0_g1_i1:82-2043(+)